MAKLLPVAREWLRKQNFLKVTDMASAPLSIPTVGRFKHRISSQFCCSLSKQGNHMNNNMNMEKWALFASH